MKHLLIFLSTLPLLAAPRNVDSPAEETIRSHMAGIGATEFAEVMAGTKRKFSSVRWSHWGLDDAKLTARGVKSKIPAGWTMKIDEYQAPGGKVGAIITYARKKGGVVEFKRVHVGQGKHSFVDAWVPQVVSSEETGLTVPMTEFPKPPPLPVVDTPAPEPEPTPNTKVTPTE